MSQNENSFWRFGIVGLAGMVVGAGGMFISHQQATTAENQFYMELDQLRHSLVLEVDTSFEEKLSRIKLLKEAKNKGFEAIFESNLQRDIDEITLSISKIAAARKESEAAAEKARKAEEARAAAAAQARKEQAVRVNPLIFENCGRGTNKICP
ncbi:hypothetical protein [Amylibacter sp. IMCC11727]|uniref:hypothetical protein n=1 Tax=Amylibacter sp. IMCC11727 TaxID=3039851 RepID=UPI00244E0B29|nr:hypothetical protein [Amylibacter sp. IMCC11727]WGI21561.1 hypothetical protein QBD29_15820 [Amylibacter sp. IMCC11727]